MNSQKIVVIEDEETARKLLSTHLANAGYEALTAESGETGLKLVRSSLPDLVVLDLMLPGIDGLAVCRELKGDPSTAWIPIMVVSGKGEEADVVQALELGADDYMTKPFSPKILLSRIKALTRRTTGRQEVTSIYHYEELELDPSERKILVKGQEIDLSPVEFSILLGLLKKQGRIFTPYQLSQSVRSDIDQHISPRIIEQSVLELRRKLGSYGDYVENIIGVGVRFSE